MRSTIILYYPNLREQKKKKDAILTWYIDNSPSPRHVPHNRCLLFKRHLTFPKILSLFFFINTSCMACMRNRQIKWKGKNKKIHATMLWLLCGDAWWPHDCHVIIKEDMIKKIISPFKYKYVRVSNPFSKL